MKLPASYADTLPRIFYREAFAHSGAYSLLLNYRGVYAMPSLDATDANTEDAGLYFVRVTTNEGGVTKPFVKR